MPDYAWLIIGIALGFLMGARVKKEGKEMRRK